MYIGSTRCASRLRRLAGQSEKPHCDTFSATFFLSFSFCPSGAWPRSSFPRDLLRSIETDRIILRNDRYLAVVTSYTRRTTHARISACSRRLSDVRYASIAHGMHSGRAPRPPVRYWCLSLVPTSRRVPTSFRRAVCPPCPPIPPVVTFSLPTFRIARSRGHPPRPPTLPTPRPRRPPEEEIAHDDEVHDDATNPCATNRRVVVDALPTSLPLPPFLSRVVRPLSSNLPDANVDRCFYPASFSSAAS